MTASVARRTLIASPPLCQRCGVTVTKARARRVTLCRVCATREALKIENRLDSARRSWRLSATTAMRPQTGSHRPPETQR